jgi:hypothetical protein
MSSVLLNNMVIYYNGIIVNYIYYGLIAKELSDIFKFKLGLFNHLKVFRS